MAYFPSPTFLRNPICTALPGTNYLLRKLNVESNPAQLLTHLIGGGGGVRVDAWTWYPAFLSSKRMQTNEWQPILLLFFYYISCSIHQPYAEETLIADPIQGKRNAHKSRHSLDEDSHFFFERAKRNWWGRWLCSHSTSSFKAVLFYLE